ncbi:hypothetical protein V6N12_054069 [Hibiscus sabdariffa]|uniref:Uncharacterized protein n=1 Tax=Hibiscus sabdariffa TaxID=183260 RepID=A0ABR2BPE7_9ROSI
MMDQQEVGGRLERPKGHLGHKPSRGSGKYLDLNPLENCPKLLGENDNKSVKEKAKNQETDIGINDRSWVDVLSVAKVGEGASNDREGETFRVDLADSEDKHHDWAQVGDRCFEAQGDLDTLNSFRELDSEFPLKKTRAAKKFEARGMGSYGKMMIVSRLVKSQRVDVFRFQEMKKITEWSVEEIRKLWPDDKFDFKAVEADGRSGGLVTLWDRNCFTLWQSK